MPCRRKATAHQRRRVFTLTRLTTDEFVDRAKKIHGDRYDYSYVHYKNAHEDVLIICRLHGEFTMEATNHIHIPRGCPICSRGGTNIERFMSKIREGSNGCWNWIGGTRGGEYGGFWVDGKTVRAHRYSYETFVGSIPDGLSILHKCDNPPCVNPNHLFAGTASDNARDMVDKGRAPDQRGSSNPCSKLDEESVVKISNMIDSGVIQIDIARQFGVSPQLITDIKKGRRWSWLTRR